MYLNHNSSYKEEWIISVELQIPFNHLNISKAPVYCYFQFFLLNIFVILYLFFKNEIIYNKKINKIRMHFFDQLIIVVRIVIGQLVSTIIHPF